MATNRPEQAAKWPPAPAIERNSGQPEQLNIRQVSVTLVAEASVAACGCATPVLHWSDVYGYGRGARRAYFYCARCGVFGFLALPWATWGEASIVDGVSKKTLLDVASAAVDGFPDLPEQIGIIRRVADDVFTRRSRCAEMHMETIGQHIADEALGIIRRRAEDATRKHEARLEEIEASFRSRHAALIDQLQRRVRERRKASARALERRKPVEQSDFPLLARGSDNHGTAIYGLVDPREPSRIRYVGQAQRPATRLAAHIAARDASKKDRWIRELAAEGVYPDMLLLERTRPGADPDTLERWWIAQMVAKGFADLNTASVPKARAEAEA